MRITPLVPPALTFVLIFIFMFSFLENLIEVDCGERRRSLSQVAQSRWILAREYFFSAHGVPIGAELWDCRSSRSTRAKPGQRPAFLFGLERRFAEHRVFVHNGAIDFSMTAVSVLSGAGID
jgi:hypothetical protein